MANAFADHTGKKFNYLTALERTDFRYHRIALWKFKCDCGNEKILNPYQVRNGHIKSCGCKQNELRSKARRLPDGEGSFRGLLRSYIRSAEKRNIYFGLSEEQFRNFTTQNCFYCGCSPSRPHHQKGTNTLPYNFNGVDRVDNELGYTFSNCVPCCGTCNLMKGTLSYEKFMSQMKTILEYRRVLLA